MTISRGLIVEAEKQGTDHDCYQSGALPGQHGAAGQPFRLHQGDELPGNWALKYPKLQLEFS